MSKPKAKTMRRPDAEPSVFTAAGAEKVAFDCLRAWLGNRIPPAALQVDIRKVNDPKWARLVMHFGTTARLASFLDVSEMTVGRWVKGEFQPDRFSQILIRAVCASLDLPSPV